MFLPTHKLQACLLLPLHQAARVHSSTKTRGECLFHNPRGIGSLQDPSSCLPLSSQV